MSAEQVVLVLFHDSPTPGSAGFVEAVKRGLAHVPGYTIVAEDRSKDYFSVFFAFDAVNDQTISVSAALGFHEGNADADYFLRQWAGHFDVTGEGDSATAFIGAVRDEITRRVAQGWLAKQPERLLLSPNAEVIKTLAGRMSAAFWSFYLNEDFEDALGKAKTEMNGPSAAIWIALADHLTWHLQKEIGERDPALKTRVQ